MGRRREGREAAVQYLFAHEIQSAGMDAGEEAFWDLHMAKKGARAFAEELVKGVLAHLQEIDRSIEAVVENYRMERLTGVDRNILRVAVYEIQHSKQAPPPVAINEAIEIAKKFGTSESSGFVNGILDRIVKDAKRLAKDGNDGANGSAGQPSPAAQTTDH